MKVVTDTEQATRLTSNLDGVRAGVPGHVAGLFPHPYPAYIKIFHAMFEDAQYVGSEATWQEAEGTSDEEAWPDSLGEGPPGELMRSGTEGFDVTEAPRIWWRELVRDELLDARANWRTLGRAFSETSWPRRIVGPDEGRLDRVSLAALIRCFTDAGAELSCVMFLEWWVAAMKRQGEGFLASLDLVVTGSVREAEGFDDTFEMTPQWWWAADQSWFIYTDYDSCVTWVAGSELLIDQIESESDLETLRADGAAIAFPDRRDDPMPTMSDPRTRWGGSVDSGLRNFYVGFAWFMVLSAFAGLTIAFAGDSLAAIPVWVSALVYAVYRLTRGVLGRSSDVSPSRQRG